MEITDFHDSKRIRADDFQVSGTLDMRRHKIENMETDTTRYPVEDHQAATKIYLDQLAEYVLVNMMDTANNGEY